MWLSVMTLSIHLTAASAVSVAPSPTPSSRSSEVVEGDIAPRLRLTLRLSRPHASEERRDLLRREYRLTQVAADFWPEFDNLNQRIFATTLQVEALGAQLGEKMSFASMPEAKRRLEKAAGWDAWLLPAGGAGLALAAMFAAMRARRRRLRPTKVALGPPAIPIATGSISGSIDKRTVAHAPQQRALSSVKIDEGLGQQTALTGVTTPPDPSIVKLDATLNLAQVLLTYGRARRATRVLRDYLAHYPKASVRPWLQLMEAYRHMGLRSEFDQAAKNLHDHFNVRTLTWDDAIAEVPLRGLVETEEEREQNAAVGGLEQIPHIFARIQAAWGSVECRDYLRQLLLDNRGGERLGFPYSVLTDILLLEDVLTELLARKD